VEEPRQRRPWDRSLDDRWAEFDQACIEYTSASARLVEAIEALVDT
jgi:hypothetical protein